MRVAERRGAVKKRIGHDYLPLVGIGADHFPAGDRPQGAPDHPIDGTLDEANATIAQECVCTAGMVAVGVDR
jgi:hypothetical protein